MNKECWHPKNASIARFWHEYDFVSFQVPAYKTAYTGSLAPHCAQNMESEAALAPQLVQ